MPKLVDHTAAKEKIAVAAWHVLRRGGLKELSVRSIAEEADLPVGTLRYYFPKQAELLLFSMELITQRVRLRLKAVSQNYTPQEKLRYALFQFLPLDLERQLEMEVWLHFISETHNGHMRQVRAETQEAIQGLFSRLLADIRQAYKLDVDVAYEANILHALVDGLTLHYLATPNNKTRQHITDTLDRHLGELYAKGAST
ncbi:MAG TPA: TetR/AcrR family transcriptional regulator [Candidatus Saccharimonadales bacterium]|nr:TetR/AcrR family transcriptional regulator [Candidatus Saccharimonadales bacterium]